MDTCKKCGHGYWAPDPEFNQFRGWWEGEGYCGFVCWESDRETLLGEIKSAIRPYSTDSLRRLERHLAGDQRTDLLEAAVDEVLRERES